MHARSLCAFALGMSLLWTAAGRAQSASTDSDPLAGGVSILPRGDLFRPLLADPKEPVFSAAAVMAAGPNPSLSGAVAFLGLGEDVGLVRWATPGGGLQVGLAGGVFAQFDLASQSTDLINTDFVVGLPLTYRRGQLSSRLRLFHQSSHLGDEYLLRAQPVRQNVVINGAELLLARDLGTWRVYGGGEYRFGRTPVELRPAVLHGGLEYRDRRLLLRWGATNGVRFVAALDGRTSEAGPAQLVWSFRSGLDFAPEATPGAAGRGWSVLLHAFRGLAPYGQFYADELSALGIEVRFNL